MAFTLLGHGYVGSAIAHELINQGLDFRWGTHEEWEPRGVIINAAGYCGTPNVDACEDHRQECVEGNVLWPLTVERRAQSLPVIHIGSGCIYQHYKVTRDGDAIGFTETDRPNFDKSFYSLSKLMAERALHPYMHKSYVLRIRMPFDSTTSNRNLLMKLAGYPKLVDSFNSLSCLYDVAKVVVHFAKTRPHPGIYNVVNPGIIKTREIVEMMNLSDKEWFNSWHEFEGTVRTPRSRCILDSEKLESVYPMPPIRESLRNCIEALRHG